MLMNVILLIFDMLLSVIAIKNKISFFRRIEKSLFFLIYRKNFYTIFISYFINSW